MQWRSYLGRREAENAYLSRLKLFDSCVKNDYPAKYELPFINVTYNEKWFFILISFSFCKKLNELKAAVLSGTTSYPVKAVIS